MYYSSAKEMEMLDRVAVESGLEIRQMMELAGFHMVGVFHRERIARDASIVIVCGKGNKGGDGLSAARHVHNHGWHNITVVLASTTLKKDPQHHLELLEKMNIPILSYEHDRDEVVSHMEDANVVIDSLIGYHLDGAPRGSFKDLIEMTNESSATVISYDVPSGVDATTGQCFNPCVNANATLTLALPKKVFQTASGRAQSGNLYLADIGIPSFLYDKVKPGSRPAFEEAVLSI